MNAATETTETATALSAQATNNGETTQAAPLIPPLNFTKEQALAFLLGPSKVQMPPPVINPPSRPLPSKGAEPIQQPPQPVISSTQPIDAVVEGAPEPKNDLPKEHSLSNTVAGRLGCPAALLLKYLDFVIGKLGKVKEGRKWYRVTLDHLSKRFPYLSRGCIGKTLKKLTSGPQSPLMTHHDNNHGYDRTTHYAFRDAELGAESRAKLRYFRPDDAVQHGIPAALLLHNLRHWAGQKDAAADGWQVVKLNDLAEALPLTLKQIRDALGSLVANGVLERVEPAGQHRFWRYRLVDPKTGEVTKVDMDVTKVDMGVTKGDMQVTKVDMGVTKRDNYNSYQSSYQPESAVGARQSESYSVRPAPPCAVSASNTPPESVELGSATVKAGERQAAVVVGSEGQAGLLMGVDAVKPAETAPVALDAANNQPATVQKLSVPQPSTLWPQTFKELAAVVGRTFQGVDGTPRANLEALIEAELDNYLPNLSIEQLDRYSQLRQADLLYVEFQPAVSAFKFSRLEGYEADVFKGMKRLAMLRLVEIFRYFDPEQGNQCRQPYTYDMLVDIVGRLKPLNDARKAERLRQLVEARNAELEARRQQHRSPDELLEDDASLSAAQKVKVLRNAINSRNRIGILDRKLNIQNNLLSFNDNSLHLAKEFFNANPAATASDLLEVMDFCAAYVADNPLEEGEYDEHYTLRKGTHLTSLLKALPAIATAAGMDGLLTVMVPVEAGEAGETE